MHCHDLILHMIAPTPALLFFCVCVSAGVCGRQPHTEELEGHRHLSAGDRGGLLAHHHGGGRAHARYALCVCL